MTPTRLTRVRLMARARRLRHRARRRQAARFSTFSLVVVLATIVGGGAAFAYFLATDNSNSAVAGADALPQGHTPTARVDGEAVTLSWAPTITSVHGQAIMVTGYAVDRYATATGGTATEATGGCAGTVSALTCTEASVPVGTWYYTVTPVLHGWVGPGSDRTVAIVAAPAFTITKDQTVTTLPGALAGGSVSHFQAAESVTVHLDTASGPILTTSPATLATDANGQVGGFSVAMPLGVPNGTHALVAVGSASGLSATSNDFSVTVPGPLDHFVVSAPTNATAGTPTTGTITITAEDAANNVVTVYTGTKCVTFSGPRNAPDGTAPTYPAQGSCSSGSAVSFVDGISTGSNSPAVTLVHAESTTLTVTDDATGKTGTSGKITVRAGSPSGLSWAGLSTTGGHLSATSGPSVNWTVIDNESLTGSVCVVDAYGNVEQNLGAGHMVTLSHAEVGGSGSTLSPSTLTISATGRATSTATFTYATDNGGWSSDAISATDAPDSYASAVVNLSDS